MQRIRITRERSARFDIAKLSIVVAAAAALVLTMTIAAPSSARLAGQSAGKPTHVTKVMGKFKTPVSSTANTRSTSKIRSISNTGGADRGAGVAPDGAGSVGPPPAGSIEAPPYIISNCSIDVSTALQTWLQGLPAGTIWYSPAGSCYLIDHGINLLFPRGLTIDGGKFLERTPGGLRRAGFDLIGGHNITFENLQIVGPNVKVKWIPARAFQGGIELQGTTNATISHVSITDVYGDGITLNPLRGSADHSSGVIIRPVENVTVDHVYIDGAGRQGISPVSVNGGTFTNISFHGIDMNAFDFEVDQGNEGAQNVTINGCTVVSANSLANFSGNASFMGPVTIENCNMATLDGGTAVYVRSTTGQKNHGPLTLTNDFFRCQPLAPVPCFSLMDAQDFVVSNSTIQFGSAGRAAPIEAVYGAVDRTNATFVNDIVSGYGRVGWRDRTSAVSITGGSWTAGRAS